MGQSSTQVPERSDGRRGQVEDYAIIRSTPRASSRAGTSAPSGSRATPPRRPSAAASRCSTPRRTAAPVCPLSLLLAARDEGRVEHHGLAGPQGRHPVLGRRRHHGPPRRAGQPHRLHQGDPRPHRAARPRGARCAPARSDCACWSARCVDYAIIALDPQGTIETWNLGAERVKGYTAEEAIGRSFAMFYTEDDRRAGLPLQLLADARETGSGRAHRLAGAQGRHPVLGRRRHHRAARRGRATSPATPRSPATAPTSRRSRTPRTPSTPPSTTTSARR